MLFIYRLLSVVITALGIVYILVNHLSIYSLMVSMATIIYVVYRAEHVPEDRLMMRKRAVLVTGCDTGFGNRLVRYLDDIGVITFAGCLNTDSNECRKLEDETSDRVHILQMDVTKDDQVAEAKIYVRKVLKEQNIGLWGLVNNAGTVVIGDAELTTIEQYLHVSNVNTFGTVRVTKAFLPFVRATEGRIVNISSTAGCLTLPLHAAYCMSKHAVETFSNILRMEMKRFNVKVIVIEPGNFAGVTDVCNKEKLKSDYKKNWDSLDTDQQDTYGESYVCNAMDHLMDGVLNSSSSNMDRIITAIEDALFLIKPKSCYLVDGGNGYVDWGTVLVRVLPYLPSSLENFVMMRVFKSMDKPKTLEESIR